MYDKGHVTEIVICTLNLIAALFALLVNNNNIYDIVFPIIFLYM